MTIHRDFDASPVHSAPNGHCAKEAVEAIRDAAICLFLFSVSFSLSPFFGRGLSAQFRVAKTQGYLCGKDRVPGNTDRLYFGDTGIR